MGANLKVREEKITFRRKQSHDLKKLDKLLEKEMVDALEKLVYIMNNSKDDRLVLQAANKILDMRKDVATLINTDDIQRLLLESKNPDRVPQLVEDDDSPAVDFTKIQEV